MSKVTSTPQIPVSGDLPGGSRDDEFLEDEVRVPLERSPGGSPACGSASSVLLACVPGALGASQLTPADRVIAAPGRRRWPQPRPCSEGSSLQKVAWGGDKALVEAAVCRAGRQPLRPAFGGLRWLLHLCGGLSRSPEREPDRGPRVPPGLSRVLGVSAAAAAVCPAEARPRRRTAARAPGAVGSLPGPCSATPSLSSPLRGSIPVPTGRGPARAR